MGRGGLIRSRTASYAGVRSCARPLFRVSARSSCSRLSASCRGLLTPQAPDADLAAGAGVDGYEKRRLRLASLLIRGDGCARFCLLVQGFESVNDRPSLICESEMVPSADLRGVRDVLAFGQQSLVDQVGDHRASVGAFDALPLPRDFPLAFRDEAKEPRLGVGDLHTSQMIQRARCTRGARTAHERTFCEGIWPAIAGWPVISMISNILRSCIRSIPDRCPGSSTVAHYLDDLVYDLPSTPMRQREPVQKQVDTSTWLTANQVVDMLGVAHDTVKGWERRGMLHPQMARRQLSNGASREVRVYDPHEVARIPKRRIVQVPNDPGEIAARAFELMDAGKSIREIVMALRETPAKVAELHDQWMIMGGGDIVIGAVATEELVRLVGPFDGVAGLVERLKETVDLVEQLRRRCATFSAEKPAAQAATDATATVGIDAAGEADEVPSGANDEPTGHDSTGSRTGSRAWLDGISRPLTPCNKE